MITVNPFQFFGFMTEQEFVAAKRASSQCSRQSTAFQLIVALRCMGPSLSAQYLCGLIGVNITAVSAVAKDLEALGLLKRKWCESVSMTPEKHHPEHGRIREYSLVADWVRAA